MRLSRLLLLVFLAIQVCDGVFTYVAVRALGPSVEGNLLLSTLMVMLGPIPTLLAAKSVAAGFGTFVYRVGSHKILAGLTALYAAVAIGPWIEVYRAWP